MRLEVFIIYAGYSHQKVEIQLNSMEQNQLVKKFLLASYGIRTYITVFTRAHHWTLSSAR